MLACGSTRGNSTSGMPGRPGPLSDKDSFGIGAVPTRILDCISLPGGGTSRSVICKQFAILINGILDFIRFRVQ